MKQHEQRSWGKRALGMNMESVGKTVGDELGKKGQLSHALGHESLLRCVHPNGSVSTLDPGVRVRHKPGAWQHWHQ